MVKVIVAGDFHLKNDYPQDQDGFTALLGKADHPWQMLERVLAAAEHADFLLLTGDLCHDGEIGEYRRLKQMLDSGRTPYLLTMGNHDIKENFEAVFGPMKKIMVLGEYVFLAVLSSRDGVADGVLSSEELEWLNHQLAKYKRRKIVVMTHHPLIKEQCDIPILPQAEQLCAALTEDVVWIITGHTHHGYSGTVNGIPYTTAPSTVMAGYGKPDGSVEFVSEIGYVEAELTEVGVETKEHSLNKSPKILGTVRF